MLISSRSLDEYCGFFGLTRAGLRALPGPVLDCPGGAAALVAEARALGCRVLAADPAYAEPGAELLARAEAARQTMARAMPAAPARYLSPRHLPYEKYLRSWDRARRLFAADRAAHPGDYVAAALPALPFADASFALTLSSYLLFAYPERFSQDDQLAALLELVRVTAPGGEVLVHPLHDAASRPSPRLPRLREALGRHGVRSELRTVRAPGDGRRRYVLALTRHHRYRAVPWTNS
ncbi:methyltransferase domain-containing protein [Kitasatospora kifunensis]|uniref:SAM-dependent methyltransferase n=1 Tax=Kitasatospora kifunensis TaxID=58351 RepID=A0A7W7VVT9_KITKI|nr:methyltransferase domain-containing protein [Kitasatospora kifunensis]MBB4924238.1 SAM-dependent methyltransferase [Kitasatospora kifunensis]